MKSFRFKRGMLRPIAFTDGAVYHEVGREGNGYIVRNDNGHARFIMPGSTHGHCHTDAPGIGRLDVALTGTFEEVSDDV
jgi:hypothetical protein